MVRLDSGIRNRQNFFILAIFLFQKLGTDSVYHADSRNIQFLVRFLGNSFSELSTNFRKCVGGAHMRGCLTLEIIFLSYSYSDGHFDIRIQGYLFDFALTYANLTPVKVIFWTVFWSKRYNSSQQHP